ncbi:MAG: hypothetical protein PHS37_03935 [Candidatus Omnitrophica bacterium]|nr:hypothetical protein [Candidatus Omnitrophota bacterium]
MENRVYKRLLLGLGFDSNDGHVRITKGKNFRLYGGSEGTHDLMQEKAVKLNEYLDKRGKTLDEIKIEEFYDIAEKIGLKIAKDGHRKKKKGG